MKKRIIAFMMFGALLFSLTGCRKTPSMDSEYSLITSEWTVIEGDGSTGEGQDGTTGGNTTGGNTTGGNTTGGNTTGGNTTGGNINSSPVSEFEVAQKVNIKNGTKPVEEGVNFGGKTFTMAITEEPQYHDAAFKRKIAAFEKKFNCKIKFVELTFGTYNTQIQQALSAGTSYDICFQHGSMYPTGINDGLYKSFSSVITSADLLNLSNPMAGGIDLSMSSYYAYKGELYGLSHAHSSYPTVMFYNKKLCSEAGIDPQKLYDEGKWNWNYISQIGKKVSSSSKDVYFLGSTSGVTSYDGIVDLTIKNGQPVVNLTNSKLIDAYNRVQQFTTGATPIAYAPKNVVELNSLYDRFFAGKSYILAQETSKWSYLAENVVKSVAFGKNLDNLGIVPIPMNPNLRGNTYPFSNSRCVTAGVKTSDIRAAACYAKFEASYVDPVQDAKTTITGTNKKYVDMCYSVKNKLFGHGRYYTSSSNTLDIMTDMSYDIYAGGDIAQLTKKAQQACEACINATWK